MIAALRAILALLALLAVYFDEALVPAALLGLAYASLIAYGVYSSGLLVSELSGRPLGPARAQPWLDALFYGYLIALSGSPGSPFFYFYFFAILTASLSRGFREGLGVTLLCVIVFTGLAFEAVQAGHPLDLDQALLRALNLLVLGGVLAYAGGREIASRRRATFLGELNSVSDLRASAQDALAQKLRLLCAFFGAEGCILLCRNPDSGEYAMYRVALSKESIAQPPTRIAESAAKALLELPDTLSIAWNARRPHVDEAAEQCRRLANLLEAAHFATVPYRRQQQIAGRLYLVSDRHTFTRSEVAFLALAADQVATVVDCYAVLDELKLDVARAERSRISRDIHDSTIQPYIGLKLGIEALYRKLNPRSAMARQVKELLEMSALSVEDLRGYVAQLRGGKASAPDGGLPDRLRAQADRCRDFWGIEVELRLARELQVNDRLAAETYQLACEALSNVWRHTRATRAFVELRRNDASLVLEVGNERCWDSPTQPFTPRSIAERASALGGEVEVRLDNDGHDVVSVSVPMQAGL